MVYGTQGNVEEGYNIKVAVFSRKDIEFIGEAVIESYIRENMSALSLPIDINHFARVYLGLAIEYRKLSDNGRLLGLTAYKDMVLELPFQDGDKTIKVLRDAILLDSSLIPNSNSKRRRFTLAHECAHQILGQVQERRTGHSFRKDFTPGNQYSYRELKTAEDWSEWQANALGAVLLMPGAHLIPQLVSCYGPHEFTLYGTRFNRRDYKRLKELSDMFDVSMLAMAIRLNTLGFIVHKTRTEYAEWLDIVADSK